MTLFITVVGDGRVIIIIIIIITLVLPHHYIYVFGDLSSSQCASQLSSSPPPSFPSLHFLLLHFLRERKLNTNLFFSNFSGTSGISRQNPGISCQKSLFSLVLRAIPNFLAPTPSCGRPPPHRDISGLRSLGSCSFFVSDSSSLISSSSPSSSSWFGLHSTPHAAWTHYLLSDESLSKFCLGKV